MSTRRSFLVLGSGAALLSALPRTLFAQQPESDVFSNRNLGAYPQGILTQPSFERVVGSVFTLFYQDGSTAALTLRSVQTAKDLAAAQAAAAKGSLASQSAASSVGSAAKPAVSGFLLSFSTGGKLVPQGSYHLDHGTLGSFAAFLVPGDPKQGGSCTACFNYL